MAMNDEELTRFFNRLSLQSTSFELRLEEDSQEGFEPSHPWQSMEDSTEYFEESGEISKQEADKENNPASQFLRGEQDCPFISDHLGDLLKPKKEQPSNRLCSKKVLAEHPLQRTRGKTFYVEETSKRTRPKELPQHHISNHP
jgi:hypothetical protein